MKIHLIVFSALIAIGLRSEAATAVAVNVNGGRASALRQGAEAAGLDLEFESETDLSHPPDVLVWQADEKGCAISSNDVAAIAKFLDNGGSLLLTVSKRPGGDMARLVPVSPAAPWPGISGETGLEQILPGIGSAEPDADFFPSGAGALRVPFRLAMRPVDRSASSENRPLRNREWKTRLFANNEARDSLLVTGRYGAGRVAVFASSAESGTDAFWKDVFAFLAAKTLKNQKPDLGSISFSANGRKGEIAVTVANNASEPAKLPVLARVSSWNGEYVDDFAESLTFPAGETTTACLKIPDGGKFRPQSLNQRRLCKVRIGVFSPDGSELLREEEIDLDGSRPISVDLQAPKDECVFLPAEKAKFTVIARNGSANEIKLDFDIAVKPFNAEETVLAERLEDAVPAGDTVSRDIEIEMPKLRGGEKFGAGRIEVLFKGKTVSYVPYIVNPECKTDSANASGTDSKFYTVPLHGTMCLDLDGAFAFPPDEDESETVFVYSRHLGQAPLSNTSDPSLLFLSEQGLAQGISPWMHVPNGDRFMDAANIGSKNANALKRSDGIKYQCGNWGPGPAVDMMFSWQEIVEFDRHLRASGASGLQGRTLRELKEEIVQTQMHPFLKWQFETYLANLRQLRDPVESPGKKFVMQAWEAPLLPLQAMVEFAEKFELEKSISDMMCDMAHKALNPAWRFARRAGTDKGRAAEALRRQNMLEAWRSIADIDGRFSPLYSYQTQLPDSPYYDIAMRRIKERIFARRISAIRPDGPIGMGLCLGTGVISDDNSFMFSGGWHDKDSLASRLLERSAHIVREMQERRIGVPFASNASALPNMPPTMREPLLVPLPDTFSADERAVVATWAKSRGMIVFVTDGKAIAPEFAELFGGAEPQQGSDAVSLSKYGVIIDRELEKITQEDFDLAAKLVHEKFNMGTVFPEGTTGYGFTSNRRRFAVVADMREEARDVTVKIRAGYGKEAIAMEFNEHRRLDVVRDGDYWSVTLPLKKADANLIMIEEK